MHIIFTEDELKYINTKAFGWPIKDKCPDTIRKSIERKKELLNSQMKGVNNVNRSSGFQV